MIVFLLIKVRDLAGPNQILVNNKRCERPTDERKRTGVKTPRAEGQGKAETDRAKEEAIESQAAGQVQSSPVISATKVQIRGVCWRLRLTLKKRKAVTELWCSGSRLCPATGPCLGRPKSESFALKLVEYFDSNLCKSNQCWTFKSHQAHPRPWLFYDGSKRECKIEEVQKGLIRCKFLIPKYLSDKDGNWHTGAIAVLIDDVAAAAICSMVGHIKVSVSFNISYFSTAKIQEEVEIEGEVVGHKDMLTLAVVRIRKKDSGEMVAFAKQWMSSTRGSSKL
ncbi:hypothetical protein Vadar_032511 [Vaccinium darrowii]|uniref:Uncharacterized protein n=1 Tax=Vaccinium darrowii TaxID=229202 RepID=A0ACB7ZP15_9ERIC|nr:hypothetical protein Vadar_032511 [Vaccinium darrowii]